MEFDPKSNDVLQLLKKLKDSNGTYPQELLAVRRQGYLKQVAEVVGGAGLAVGLRNTVKNVRGGASGLPPAMGTLLEGLLVVAIVAEGSTLAYFYRSQIAQYIQKFTNQPKVQEVISPPVVSSTLPGLQVTPNPLVTPSPLVIGTVTETETPVSAPTLQLAGQPTNPSTGQGGGTSGAGGGQAVSTSVSSDGGSGSGSSGNNGNHYGQTPIPERTKDPGGSDSTDSGSSSSQDTQTNPKNKNK